MRSFYSLQSSLLCQQRSRQCDYGYQRLAEIDAPEGSTRAASATWASARAVPISTIMAAADWSSVRTMARHYIRPLPQGDFD